MTQVMLDRQPTRLHPRHSRVAVLREARYADHAQPAGLVEVLRSAGHEVTVVDPQAVGPGRRQHRLRDVVNSADVMVARGRSDAVLAVLRAAAEVGVPVLDPAEAVARVRDKVAMANVLRRAGVPTPATFIAPTEMLAARVPPAAYPLILKPVFGDNAEGLKLVMSQRELRLLNWPDRIALAQSHIPGDGVDLKVYAIGNHLTAVHKPSPINPCTLAGARPADLDDRLAHLARTCGRLFGLSLYGVDCLDTPSGPVVLEINDFPNFTAVPDANRLLADHVLATARSHAGSARRSA